MAPHAATSTPFEAGLRVELQQHRGPLHLAAIDISLTLERLSQWTIETTVSLLNPSGIGFNKFYSSVR